MGIFDRVGNLGKGMIKTIGKDLEQARADAMLEAELTVARLRGRADAPDPDDDPFADRLRKLTRLHESGLLTDEEYAEKLVGLEAELGGRPRRRTQLEDEEVEPVRTKAPAGPVQRTDPFAATDDEPASDPDEPPDEAPKRVKKTL